ncbi:hypothetical protein [Nocardioides sp. KR10-350]|uniref:hypothetical protein n=1 Tax=Nocardioides cheoyonin TaxID=3156615 RepID=UPI0032B428A2
MTSTTLPTLARLYERREVDVALLPRMSAEHFDAAEGHFAFDVADRRAVETLTGEHRDLVRAGILAAALWLDRMGFSATNAAVVSQAIGEVIAASGADLHALRRIEIGLGWPRPLPVALLVAGTRRVHPGAGSVRVPRFVDGGIRHD